jgi:hypothetical protein
MPIGRWFMTRDKKGGYYKTVVQIDVDNPAEDRRAWNGRKRLGLNDDERKIIQKKARADEALVLFIEKSMSMPDIAKQLDVRLDELVAMSISPYFPEFRAAVAEKLSSLYLDTDKRFTVKEICEVVGMTPNQLRNFTNSDEFKDRYNKLFTSLTADPMIKAVEIGIVENLLSKAYVTLESALNSKNENVKLKAALEVLKYAGVKPQEAVHSDKTELAVFLKKQGLNLTVNNFNVEVPQEFKDAVSEYSVIEGEAREVPALDEGD